jgi:hypothetical protein
VEIFVAPSGNGEYHGENVDTLHACGLSRMLGSPGSSQVLLEITGCGTARLPMEIDVDLQRMPYLDSDGRASYYSARIRICGILHSNHQNSLYIS